MNHAVCFMLKVVRGAWDDTGWQRHLAMQHTDSTQTMLSGAQEMTLVGTDSVTASWRVPTSTCAWCEALLLVRTCCWKPYIKLCTSVVWLYGVLISRVPKSIPKSTCAWCEELLLVRTCCWKPYIKLRISLFCSRTYFVYLFVCIKSLTLSCVETLFFQTITLSFD